jgi:hypothetical protein
MLDAEIVAEIESIAGPDGLSEFVEEGVRLRLSVERERSAVAAYERDVAPISAEALRRVDDQWPT